MSKKLNELKESLLESENLLKITAAFTETDAYRIKLIRAEFEKNLDFYREISQVYHLVKASNLKKRRLKEASQGLRTLRIAATSNSAFYGNLNRDVAEKFYRDARESNDDLLVVGQTGISYLSLRLDPRRFSVLRFRTDFPSHEEITDVIKATSDYEKILLYYPKFIRLTVQRADVEDITQTSPLELKGKKELRIIFEPEIEKILAFFESQVRSLLFRRAMLETSLSRTAARLLTMSTSERKAEELRKVYSNQYLHLSRSVRNARLLNTFSGMKIWKKTEDEGGC